MEITYQNTEQDYLAFHRSILQSRLKKRASLDVFLIMLIAYAYNGASFKLPGFLIISGITAIIFFSVFYLVPYIQTSRLIRKIMAGEESTLEEKKLIVVDEGINIESPTKITSLKWENLIGVGANNRVIYLLLTDKKYLLLPKHNFKSTEETSIFLEMVQNKITRIRGESYEKELAKGKPPYLLGLICLIPVIGALMGLILLLYGVFKYKDKWLIIIGIAGMIWTGGVYEGTKYYVKTSFGQRHILAASSQNTLDSLTKAIEAYRLKNGVYPDSLMQITDDNPITIIMDPLRFKDANADFNHIQFIYKKVGDHYYLFSAGTDGVANTEDDIYPEDDNAGGKSGLIRK